MQSFEDLQVWKKAIDLVEEIYTVTAQFPKKEIYSLCDQLQRAAVSVPSNIAEGCQRKTGKEFTQFLYMAYGSCAEVRTQLIISKRLGYLQDELYVPAVSHAQEIEKMLNSLIRAVELRSRADNLSTED